MPLSSFKLKGPAKHPHLATMMMAKEILLIVMKCMQLFRYFCIVVVQHCHNSKIDLLILSKLVLAENPVSDPLYNIFSTHIISFHYLHHASCFQIFAEPQSSSSPCLELKKLVCLPKYNPALCSTSDTSILSSHYSCSVHDYTRYFRHPV